jgi:hypothetical protein
MPYTLKSHHRLRGALHAADAHSKNRCKVLNDFAHGQMIDD